MKRLLGLSFVLTLLPFMARAYAGDEGAGTVYNEAGATVTHDCGTSPRVAINGWDGTFTFTGACTKISLNGANNKVTVASIEKMSVTGSENTVALDAVGKLAVMGSDNKITWKRGLAGKTPKVSVVGVGNSVAQAK